MRTQAWEEEIEMALNIVLVEPEIPQNAGNIIRTCAATGSNLHFVRPLGFETSDKHFRRAGLDYFDKSKIFYHDSAEAVMQLAACTGADMFFASTKSQKNYCEVSYRSGDFLFFGRESRGLPEPMLEKYYDRCVRIPMLENIRSLNLSNSVAIILYEALRQLGFENFTTEGNLTGRGY